jgi:hypothetical protein
MLKNRFQLQKIQSQSTMHSNDFWATLVFTGAEIESMHGVVVGVISSPS